MTYQQVAVRHSATSGGALAVLGCGLVLYQLTNLALGPQGSRQLQLSINLPAVETQDVTEPIQARVNVVVGDLVSFVNSKPAVRAASSMPSSSAAVPVRHASPVASHAVPVSSPVTQASRTQPLPAPVPLPLPTVKLILPLPTDRDTRDAGEARYTNQLERTVTSELLDRD